MNSNQNSSNKMPVWSSKWSSVKLVTWLVVAILVVSSQHSQAKNQPIGSSSEPKGHQQQQQQQQPGASDEGQSVELVASKGQASDKEYKQPTGSTSGGPQSVFTEKLKGEAPPPPVGQEKQLKSQVVEEKLEKVKSSVEKAKFDKDSSTIVDVLTCLGFEHEVHNCNSLDGYTTQLVRMVNPLLKGSRLRKHPVVLYTGQGTSPAVFLAGSLDVNSGGGQGSGQSGGVAHNWYTASGAQDHSDEHLVGDIHHEAALSRGNRSLAAMLSNIGFDVWLVPTRGVDAQNRARNSSSHINRKFDHHHHKHGHAQGNSTSKQVVKRSLDQTNKDKGLLAAKLVEAKQLMKEIEIKNKPKFNVAPKDAKSHSESGFDLTKFDLIDKLRHHIKELVAKSYWSFSSDEIIQLELEQQLECVRSLTKSPKLSLISYSNGGFVTFAFLARQSHYAHQHLDVVLNLAPAVFVNKLNLPLSLASLASKLNLFDEPFPSEQFGSLGRKLCRNKHIKSTACKLLLEQLYGPSKLFESGSESELELMFERFLAKPMSVRALQQSLQVAHAGKMQEFDHGLLGNVIFYNQPKPRPYQLEQVKHERLFVVSGESDAIVDKSSLVQLVGSIGSKPLDWIKVPHYNHLDCVLAHDNHKHVNWPVARILLDRDLELDYYHQDEEEEVKEDLSSDLELRDEKDRQDETNDGYYDEDEQEGQQQNDEDGAGGETNENNDDNENGAHESYKSQPNNSQQQQHLEEHEDHRDTVPVANSKNYYEQDDKQTDQSAEQPVQVQNGPLAKLSPSSSTLIGKVFGRQLPKTFPKEQVANSNANKRAVPLSSQLPGPDEPCSKCSRKQVDGHQHPQ